MGTWNYRIVEYLDGSGYGLHEVHYNKDGKAWGMTASPIYFRVDAGEGPDSLVSSLCTALKDAMMRGVFKEPGKWADR